MNRSALWRAIAVAGHAGDEGTARAALTADDEQARVLGLGALERMGALQAADLHAAATDPTAPVRRRVAELAATHHDVDLERLLQDPDVTVVETAAWAAGERAEAAEPLVPRLIELAAAEDALVREASIAALGAIGDERGLPAVLAGCSDKPAVRRRAVLALAAFEGPEVDAALEAALQDHDWQVRQAAEDVAPDDR